MTDDEIRIYKKKLYENGIVVGDYNNEIITQRHQGLLEIDFGDNLFQEQKKYSNKMIEKTYTSFNEAFLSLKYTSEGKGLPQKNAKEYIE